MVSFGQTTVDIYNIEVFAQNALCIARTDVSIFLTVKMERIMERIICLFYRASVSRVRAFQYTQRLIPI